MLVERQNYQMAKILFTGGHHNSALATIDWLKSSLETNLKLDFYWIGRKNSGNVILPEFTEVTARNIPFYNLVAGKLFRTSSVLYFHRVIFNLLLVPVGFVQSIYYLFKIQPDLIVSFGGYMAVPVVVGGRLLGIKSVLHEQTATLGLANKITSKFVDKIFTAWPLEFYVDQNPKIKDKMAYTGLPIRNAIPETKDKHSFTRDLKTIYITGGKSGSLFLNKTFLEVLHEVASEFNVIWSCGRRVGEADYHSIKSKVESLPEDLQKNIVIKEYFLEDEIGKVFNTADLIISRGGAHTVYELALIKKPAILIPIPWSSNQEQLKNSRILESFGLATVLDQEKTTPYSLLAVLEEMKDELDKIKENVKGKEFVPANGQELLGNEIITSASKS